MNTIRIAACAFAIAATAFAGAPQAAESKETPPVSAAPQKTSATYGDWIVNCSRPADNPQAARTCEVVQSFQVQGQQGLFAVLAIGHVPNKTALQVTYVMQPNMSFPSTVKLTVDDKDTQPVELSWLRCVPGNGCFASAELKEDVLKRWRAQTGNGRLVFKDGLGREVPISFSFRGLAPALDALAKG